MPGAIQAGLPNALPYADLATITGNENLLILAPGPGGESVGCGGLVAGSCRRGRPPFIMVLGDGTSALSYRDAGSPDEVARLRERETRMAASALGLDGERLLMAGLYDGHIPHGGPVFETVVRAVTLVMWRRDCNVICAPWPSAASPPDECATYRIAAAVAAASGVGLLACASHDPPWATPGVGPGWRLDITPHLAAKRKALAAHAWQHGSGAGADGAAHAADFEVFLRPGTAA